MEKLLDHFKQEWAVITKAPFAMLLVFLAGWAAACWHYSDQIAYWKEKAASNSAPSIAQPRNLTQRQQDDLTAMLKPYSRLGVTVGLYWRMDKEAVPYGKQWATVLRNADWKLVAEPAPTEVVGVLITTKHGLDDPTTLPSISKAVEVLKTAFDSVGIKPHTSVNSGDLKDDQLYIAIGEHE